MRKFLLILVYALALLSAAAGIPKIMQMPQELGFLNAIGFNAIAVSLLGLAQLAGAILLLWTKTRLIGAGLAGLSLLLSSVAILVSGNTQFGLISLLPLVVLIVVIGMLSRPAAGSGN